jgi:hypothetical protein
MKSTPTTQVTDKKALWNWIGVAFVPLNIFLSVMAYKGTFTGGGCGSWGMDCLFSALVSLGLCGALGLIASFTAYLRSEPFLLVTWIGLVLNGLLMSIPFILFLKIWIK